MKFAFLHFLTSKNEEMTIDENWHVHISWKQICIMYDCQICKVNTSVLSNGSHFKTQGHLLATICVHEMQKRKFVASFW